MKSQIVKVLKAAASCTAFLLVASQAVAEKSHGIAMYGEPALSPDFNHLPYANPDAPKGGIMITGESGGFDSLNPYIVKGRAPFFLGTWTVESLMARSIDEPFTLYGLLAESVETDDERSFVEFTLRPEARFSDGTPVTIKDVIWSFETLAEQGQPRYAGAWHKVRSVEQTGPRSVRFVFTEPDREMPLILGLRPVLKRAQWENKDFTQSTLEAPIGSGPYRVESFVPNRSITYRRDPDWWGKDLPFNRGLYNFDEMRTEFYADSSVMFEAFKAGSLSLWREGNPSRWLSSFDFPAVRNGDIVLEEIPHRRPSGMHGFVMNTRDPMFDNWRVREAMILAFDFGLINRIVTGGTEPRIESYFSNSDLGMEIGTPVPADEADLLAPYRDSITPGALEGYALPRDDAPARSRQRRAMALLQEAGWTVEDGVLTKGGQPFRFDILLPQSAGETASVAAIYVQSLQRLGIEARVVTVDAAQYRQRITDFDFDMTEIERSFSLSPGNEQMLYGGSSGADQTGSRNLMGVASPAVDAMVTAMVRSQTPREFQSATRALDRLLMAGRYVIPFWYSPVSRIAYRSNLRHPDRLPLYGDWPGFEPETWWAD
ncbi:extracellular solute-binding protein [Falsirhodobacter deserti]|uniref:extracellular solute-binding protein n=1 Tax=Falsirhodobacter deserti TaxID=1365611 RepID=UPI001F4DE699|nr:extracellular solute-binding protein [Falsirhodobacter deserti]